jgi:hypothetical protein
VVGSVVAYVWWDESVENERGDGGGRGRPCEYEDRKFGVPNGEGRSGSMRRLALREARKAGDVLEVPSGSVW